MFRKKKKLLKKQTKTEGGTSKKGRKIKQETSTGSDNAGVDPGPSGSGLQASASGVRIKTENDAEQASSSDFGYQSASVTDPLPNLRVEDIDQQLPSAALAPSSGGFQDPLSFFSSQLGNQTFVRRVQHSWTMAFQNFQPSRQFLQSLSTQTFDMSANSCPLNLQVFR